jgi:TatD DNase family protein
MIDTHAHLTSEALYPHLEALLQEASKAHISHIVNICTDELTLERALKMRFHAPKIYHTASTTPHDVEKEGDSFFPIVEGAAKRGDLVAIGETGLDYYYEHSKKELQKKFFVKYLHLALETNLPVVIHCREAFSDFFEIIDSEYKSEKGVLHCFTGTLEEAKRVLDRGWMVSLSGIVTFKKSVELKEVAKMVPLDRLFIETDAPYLAPQSKRGRQNTPAFIVETAAHIAELKKMSIEDLIRSTTKNAKRFFGITVL